MGVAKKIEVDTLERVCLYYEIMTGRKDYKLAYKTAKGRPDEVIDANSQYYRWMNSNAVRREIHAIEGEKARQEAELLEKVKKDYQKSMELEAMDSSTNGLATDFRNREQFLNWLNQQVNLVDDDKMRVDYLKMLSDLMRFKEADNKDKEQDIQRFYTPLQCRECNLYLKQEKLVEGK